MTYTGLAFPKPKSRKGNSRKVKNNPKPTIYDKCVICDRPYASLHEVFYGNDNRQNSIDYGMQIRLCIYHHQVGPEAVHNNPTFNRQLKEKHQRIFEQQHGHGKFMEVSGENFIDESEWVFMDE